eukprot:303105-Chlamydomonas_euryale.AAC.1
MPRVQPATEPNIQGMGEACGVGQRTVAARSLGAHGMYTMSDRGAAQSSRVRQVRGASKQHAEAHQSS